MGIEKKVENDDRGWSLKKKVIIGVAVYELLMVSSGMLYAGRKIDSGKSYEEAKATIVKMADDIVKKSVIHTSFLPGVYVRYKIHEIF